MQNVKPYLEISPPKEYQHLQLSVKKLQVRDMLKQRNEEKKRAVREGKVYDLALFKKKYINFLFWILQIPLSVKLLTS